MGFTCMSKKDEFLLIVFFILTISSIYTLVYTMNEVSLTQTIQEVIENDIIFK
jgi:hypothetical protein